MNEVVKVKHLPKDAYHFWRGIRNYFHGFKSDYGIATEIGEHNSPYVREDMGPACPGWTSGQIISEKLKMHAYVRGFFIREGIAFDEFNGLPPTRLNKYRAYEFSALWLWSFMRETIDHPDENVNKLTDTFYEKLAEVISSVFKKYPNSTGLLMQELDLKVPGNKFVDYAKMEEANWDSDSTTDYQTDDKADKFKNWVITEASEATDKDKMRVNNWFVTKKSHKQILAEINKVSGNYYKFNSRLALFVERLFNKEGLDYFFEKTGFNSKEELFMTYFEKLTMFDDETKKSFIRKYLIG